MVMFTSSNSSYLYTYSNLSILTTTAMIMPMSLQSERLELSQLIDTAGSCSKRVSDRGHLPLSAYGYKPWRDRFWSKEQMGSEAVKRKSEIRRDGSLLLQMMAMKKMVMHYF